MKKRIDLILFEKKIVESREKAKDLINWGKVLVNGKIAEKPGKKFDEKSKIEIKEIAKYVGRAGYKLEKAVNEFKIKIKDKVCLDIGSSTGGFVDFLLQNGAKKVYAVEIAKDQLHPKLRENPKVINIEGQDIRTDFNLPEKADFCSIDVTFLSLEEVLKIVIKYLNKNSDIVALIKPPFELKSQKKSMAIRKEEDQQAIIQNLISWCKENNLEFIRITESPIEGKGAGQKEFLMYIKFR